MSAARWARIRNCAQYASVRSVIKLLKIGRGVVKMALRLKEKYRQEVVPALRKEFNYSNPMQVPTVKKVVVNIEWAKSSRMPKRWKQPSPISRPSRGSVL